MKKIFLVVTLVFLTSLFLSKTYVFAYDEEEDDILDANNQLNSYDVITHDYLDNTYYYNFADFSYQDDILLHPMVMLHYQVIYIHK